MVKNLPTMQETKVQSLEGPLEKGMTTHSSIRAWRSPWTEEPGGVQHMGSQKVRHGGIFPKKIKTLIGKDVIPMSTKVLFTRAKIRKQPKCQSIED